MTPRGLPRARPDALLVTKTTSNSARRRLIVDFATKYRLPGMCCVRSVTRAGGLISYGPEFRDHFQLAASCVDGIRTGAKPAGLPVEQPTKVELVTYLEPAKALGLTIPPSVLARADEVIQ